MSDDTVLDPYEERLLGELRAVVAAQAAEAHEGQVPSAAPGRGRWFVPAAGVAAVVVAVTLAGVLARPSPAYAVTGGNGEEVRVRVTRLEGPEALQAALRDRGVPADITYLPPASACAPGRFREVRTPGLGLSVGADRFEVVIPPGAVGEGDTFVLSASVTPLEDGARSIVHFGVTDGPVAPCRVVDVP